MGLDRGEDAKREEDGEPATAHSSSAPAPVASPSQLAHDVAFTSGWRFSQAELSSAKAVQLASDAMAKATPRQKCAPPSAGAAACDDASISASPAAVSTSPGTSALQRRWPGLPSSITHRGIVPITRLGTSLPASRIAKTSSR